ncbi:MAG: NAD(P)/FAD-dependent oxidoreductase [Ruminococcus sp.]
MIRINQLKLPVNHDRNALIKKITHTLRISEDDLVRFTIVRQSLDARKKPDLFFVYSVDITLKESLENKILKKINNKNITSTKEDAYTFSAPEMNTASSFRPVIAGSGPAGLFCAWLLARCGFSPLILERGECVEERVKTVNEFWKNGVLNEESNVQFGEGGAGTFSDGKLNTTVKDPKGRNRQVLRLFVEAGAPAEILYQQKPHLGTDQLIAIVKNLRRMIEQLGGRFIFHTKLTDFSVEKGRITGIQINGEKWLPADALICAIGHSARDTFEMLYSRGISMTAKAFAAGIRIEHPQEMINESQYGRSRVKELGAASYKVTHQTDQGRGVYSFCMCPGGYVVNASSERGFLAVNGMSYHGRASQNANSALIVTVTPEDFPAYTSLDIPEALRGIAFQRMLEQRAFDAGGGSIPLQLFDDFCHFRKSSSLGKVAPCIKGSYQMADVRSFLPPFIGDSLEEGIRAFGKKINGFDRGDCLIAGVESRSSSPVRIIRDESFQSNIRGFYPCGEGAGYAGGITSAAIDGLKTAEAVILNYVRKI